jgi:hypothetical protein
MSLLYQNFFSFENKISGELSYMSDPCQKIVFTSEEPSICMLYDSKTGLHSVWKVRKALPEVSAYHKVT